MGPTEHGCHLCHAGPSWPVAGFEALPRVTSDCRPWPPGGHLRVCPSCGVVHKSTDAAWREEIARIYGGYDIYYQSGGIEQPVSLAEAGGPVPRSQRLLECFAARFDLPGAGRLLDVGCGNGGFLRSFHRAYPGWSMVGTEVNDRHQRALEAWPAVESVHTGPLEEVPGRFDLASMIHVLEHIPDPGRFLDTLHEKLGPAGWLLVDLPAFQHNPFDLVIADHCTHFSPEALEALMAEHGFTPQLTTVEWIRKECVLVGRKDAPRARPAPASVDAITADARQAVRFLHAIVAAARALKQLGRLGIFGTSIAGTWLAGAVEGAFDFWVDEDPDRIGRDHLGKRVVSPIEVPPGERVLIAQPPALADTLAERLAALNPGAHWHGPSRWPA